MIQVTSIVEEDILGKIDTESVKKELNALKHKEADTSFVFICTKDNDWKQESWSKNKKRYHSINLPYEEVKKMDERSVVSLMLKLALEKLSQFPVSR